jgi:hypothetical protein
MFYYIDVHLLAHIHQIFEFIYKPETPTHSADVSKDMFQKTVPHFRAKKNPIYWMGGTHTEFWWGNHFEIE